MAANLSLAVEVDREEPDTQRLRVYWDGEIAKNGDRIPGTPLNYVQYPGLEFVQIWTEQFQRAGDGFGKDGLGADGVEQALYDLQDGDGLGQDGFGEDGLVANPTKIIKLPGIFRDGTYNFKVVQVNHHGTESTGLEKSINVIGTVVRAPKRLRVTSITDHINLVWEASPDVF